ncbi:hypothetical protein DFP72DRAFT_859358 [Ephemerocybe angulata]|uniref:MIR domain-containing protein n=1 Tax=Ephemerocybe angulata TaxID=980116 RepID=A0A8H6HA38_9AGAR|nr:hypothetical protein DFP72DRAFT_859358 [Tulosesus angulatus]
MHLKALLSTAVLFSTCLTTALANADATSADLDALMKTAGLGTGPSELNEEALGRYLELKDELFPTPTTTNPVKRAEEYEIQKLSNAERLARGFPLKAPARRRHSKIFARDPVASPAPRTTLNGRAALYRDDLGGAFFGYVDRTFIGSNQARYTTNAADAMILSVSFDSLQTNHPNYKYSRLNRCRLSLPMPHSRPSVTGIGIVITKSNSYTYLSVAAVSAGPGPAGTTSNAYNSLTGASRIAQTDINRWTFLSTPKVPQSTAWETIPALLPATRHPSVKTPSREGFMHTIAALAVSCAILCRLGAAVEPEKPHLPGEEEEEGEYSAAGNRRDVDAGKDVYSKPKTGFLLQKIAGVVHVLQTLLSCWSRSHRIGACKTVVWDEANFLASSRREFNAYIDVYPTLGKCLSASRGCFQATAAASSSGGPRYSALCRDAGRVGDVWSPYGAARVVYLSNLGAQMSAGYESLVSFYWPLCSSSSVSYRFLFNTRNSNHSLSTGGYGFSSPESPSAALPASLVCLIVVSALVFMASFKFHFLILNHSGAGDSQMSALFQMNVKGNDFYKNPLDVAFGSRVTLKNMGWGVGLLHPHVQTYPVGSKRQQMACDYYKDNNNEWNVLPAQCDKQYELEDGDIIRLSHVPTGRDLHSHTVTAPVAKLNYEVSGHGNLTVGDSHDYWQVGIVDGTKGFKQIEVNCDKEKDGCTHVLELPAGDMKLYKTPFLLDFWHLNVGVMSNDALIPDPGQGG